MADDATENKPNPAEAFQNLLQKHNNDGVKLASQLFDENFQYRQQLRELKQTQPKDGAIVLSAEEAKDYGKFKSLLTEQKLDLKQVREIIEKHPELERQNRQLSNTETIYELSEIGLDGSRLNRKVLKEQVFEKFPDAQVAFKTEKDKDGREQKVAYITHEGKESSFNEFAKEKLPDYISALKVEPTQTAPKPGASYDPKPAGNALGSLAERMRAKAEALGKQSPRSLDEVFGRAA